MSTTTRSETTIVCASDLSEASRMVLDTAIELAALYEPACVHVLHVHEVPERIENLQERVDEWEARRAALRAEIDEEIAKVRAQRPGLTLEVRSEVSSGKPYREILDYALRVHAKILVVGTHGHAGFRHTLLGSVAERVVRHAPCTVVVAKPAGVCKHLALHLASHAPRRHRARRTRDRLS